jgi:DNA-binding transcriptional ArsR family regulator
MDFLKLRLESYLSDEIRKPELDHLEAGPVLFHSGYLTLDKSAFRPVMDLNSEKTKLVESYSFKLPNFEVSSSYYKDCFSVILGLKLDDLLARREELQEAFLSRDADKVSAFFKKNFARLSYLQKLKSGRNVRLLVQALLMSLSFKVQDEVADQTGRLDLCFEIQERVYVLIELKFIPAQRSLSSEDKTEALAKVALDILSTQARNEILASVVKNKLSVSEYLMALEKKGQADAPAPIKSQCLGQAALEYLTEAEYSAGLAEAVKKELGKAEIKEILKKAGRTLSPPSERIDQELSEAAAKALRDIAEKDYRGVIKNKAEVPPKEIIDLGLSVYGDGKRVVAAFGSK